MLRGCVMSDGANFFLGLAPAARERRRRVTSGRVARSRAAMLRGSRRASAALRPPAFSLPVRRLASASATAERLLAGDRGALSRSITLIESTHPKMRAEASALLSAVLPQRPASHERALRIGISGPPGAGKSTLIEALGCELSERGHRLAVLAVDPSSQRSGGSILGDKTRMTKLSADRRAYVRATPSKCTLGGVSRHTEDAILLCECAGYDRIIVETVGVGQSEVAVANMVDIFLLLVPPAAGDELQGIKRGIMELADAALVTKADGGLKPAATQAAGQLRAALKVLRPRSEHWSPPVLQVSTRMATNIGDDGRMLSPEEAAAAGGFSAAEAAGGAAGGGAAGGAAAEASPAHATSWSKRGVNGVEGVIAMLESYRSTMERAGALDARRAAQAVRAVREHTWARLLELVESESSVDELVQQLAAQTADGRLSPSQAGASVADRIIATAAADKRGLLGARD